ncbi:MAG: MBL fold metallo-hydrolase [Chryseolinea sp.]
MTEPNYIQLIRHATLIIQLDNRRLLVDPMLSAKEQLDPVANCGNDRRIPMVDLPFERSALPAILDDADAVLLTHLHRDHWDIDAQRMILHKKKIFCQPVDVPAILHQGFVDVVGIEDSAIWNGWKIVRTDGQHGTGEIGQKMGAVSGYVLSKGDIRVYVAGDTIWCEPVALALEQHKPTHIVLNTGGAKFLAGDPITMTALDVEQVAKSSNGSQIIAVHMDTVNHCLSHKKTAGRATS